MKQFQVSVHGVSTVVDNIHTYIFISVILVYTSTMGRHLRVHCLFVFPQHLDGCLNIVWSVERAYELAGLRRGTKSRLSLDKILYHNVRDEALYQLWGVWCRLQCGLYHECWYLNINN